MRQAGAEEIAFMVEEDLRLVNQPAECGGMHDAVAVALVVRAGGGTYFHVATASSEFGMTRIMGKLVDFKHNIFTVNVEPNLMAYPKSCTTCIYDFSH